MTIERRNGLTLMETMIVVGILVLMMTATLVGLNVKTQLARGMDGKRKNDLNMLGKALEDFQGDKNRYPTAAEICYDTPTASPITCHICGDRETPTEFMPYANNLPCDRGANGYLYEINDADFPLIYRIYTKLDNLQDPSIGEVGCSSGCGPGNAYNYGIYGGNTLL